MTKIKYNKPALTYQEQLSLLKGRGLTIEDETKAEHILKTVGYYRLSGYWHSLLKSPKSDDKFKPNSSFSQAFSMYCFDRELRLLLIGELEKIEIAVRTQLIYQLSHKHGPFWFNNKSLFKNHEKWDKTLSKIEAEVDDSTETFIKEFFDKYSDETPPAWITLEVVSFGKLSSLYSNLKNDGRSISSHFGLSSEILSSWLHTFVYVRNVCAHHSRLWNKKLAVSPRVPRSTYHTFLTKRADNTKVYYLISMLLYFLQQINPKSTFKNKLSSLFNKYPQIDREALGFPKHWESESLWRQK